MLLSKILQTLSQKELDLLRAKLSVPERSLQLLEKLADPTIHVNTKELCKEFNISATNLYRLCSELADECISLLAPEHEFAKLEFFRKRFLSSLFTNEVARNERALLETRDYPQLERLYEYAIDGMFGFSIVDVDMSLVESYGMKWIQIAHVPILDHELLIRMRAIYGRICALPGNKKMTVQAMNLKAKEWLSPVSESAPKSGNSLVQYYYYQSQWKATNYDNVVGDERIAWLAKSLEVISTHPQQFPEGSVKAARLLYGYERASYCGEVEEGFALYHDAYDQQTPETSKGGLFLLRYMKLAILTKHFAIARALIERVESFSFVKTTSGIYVPMMIHKIVLDLLEGKLDDVASILSTTNGLNTDEHFFLTYEIELRLLETVYAFKRNDLERAELLAVRNIKWMHTRRYSLSQSPYPYFYQAIRAAITFKLTGEKPRALLFHHFDQFAYIAPEYALLLEQEIAAMRETQ